MQVGSSAFVCNPIQLNGAPLAGQDFDFDDLGGNRCGCEEEELCQVLSTMLEAPTPIVP